MTDRLTTEQVLRELYQARASGQLERLCGLFCADARFRISGSTDSKPIAIVANGIDEIREWLGTLVKTFRITNHEIFPMFLDGPRAAVHWKASIYSRITGAAVSTELVDLVELRDGQIVSYVEFFVPS